MQDVPVTIITLQRNTPFVHSLDSGVIAAAAMPRCRTSGPWQSNHGLLRTRIPLLTRGCTTPVQLIQQELHDESIGVMTARQHFG
ncbi:hypothetical protein A3216_03605 [Mycobacterium leprae 7935681]|nr:hypothetical protein A3216_03605 [Mycobacterium leprae 7935681]